MTLSAAALSVGLRNIGLLTDDAQPTRMITSPGSENLRKLMMTKMFRAGRFKSLSLFKNGNAYVDKGTK